MSGKESQARAGLVSAQERADGRQEVSQQAGSCRRAEPGRLFKGFTLRVMETSGGFEQMSNTTELLF